MSLNLNDNIYGYFLHEHGAYEYRNGWLRIPTCPFCGREEKFGVHIPKNRCHCFRCDHDDKLLNTVMIIENITTLKDTIKFLYNFKDVEYRAPKVERVEEREVILPEGFRTLRRGDYTIGDMARSYVKKRGFDYKKLSRQGVGYTIDPESKYYGYLIVPFMDNGKVIYFQTRRFFGTGAKFNNPKYEDYGIGKNQIIYNKIALKKYSEVNVVESFTNAWTLGDNSIGLNGKTLSTKQLSEILRSKARLFNILLDHDAWEYAYKIAMQLHPYKQVRLIWFEDDRDVNELGSKVVLDKIDDTPILANHGAIIKHYNRYKNEVNFV